MKIQDTFGKRGGIYILKIKISKKQFNATIKLL